MHILISQQGYYCLEMSPRGDVQAYAADFYSKMDWDWQCKGLQVFAQIEGNRYTFTGSIPLESLRNLKVLRGHEIHAGPSTVLSFITSRRVAATTAECH